MFALSTKILNSYPELGTAKQQISFLTSIWDGVFEIGPEITKENIKSYEKAVEEGLQVASVHAPLPSLTDNNIEYEWPNDPSINIASDNEENRKKFMDVLKQTIITAKQLKAKILTLHFGFADGDKRNMNYIIEAVKICNALCKKHGLILAIEYPRLNSYEIPNLKELLLILEACEASVTFDFGHAFVNKIDTKKEIELLKDSIVSFHLHDNNGKEDEHLLPGTYHEKYHLLSDKLMVFELGQRVSREKLEESIKLINQSI